MKKHLVLSLTLILVLSACSVSKDQSALDSSTDGPSNALTESASDTGQKKTLKIFQYKAEIADQLIALADEYMQLHPEIDLQVESVTSTNYNTLLKTKFASGEAPDIFNNQGYSEFEIWQEKLEDLSDQPWIVNMGDITKEGISDENGKIYGLPLYIEGYNFVYNPKLFNQAGITKVPATLSELETVCTQLESAGIPAIIISLNGWYNMGTFGANVAMAHQEDVNSFIDGLNKGTATFEDNEIFNEWVDLIDLMVKHAYRDPLTTTFSDQISQLANEEAAITLTNNGCWLSCLQINPNVELDFFNIPINDDAAYNDVLFAGVSSYWVINRDSTMKKEAKEFLNWLVSSERSQYYITQEFNLVSGLTSIPSKEEDVGALGVAVSEAVAQGKVLGWEWSKYPAGMTEEFGNGIQKYVSGSCSKQEMLEGFTQVWRDLSN